MSAGNSLASVRAFAASCDAPQKLDPGLIAQALVAYLRCGGSIDGLSSRIESITAEICERVCVDPSEGNCNVLGEWQSRLGSFLAGVDSLPEGKEGLDRSDSTYVLVQKFRAGCQRAHAQCTVTKVKIKAPKSKPRFGPRD